MQQTNLELSRPLSDTLSSGFPDKMVLLDCETTGGKSTYHRITEIGLVVIEQGEIVEQWSSLIDPQRSIPPPITALTGISDDMVASAPLFSDIADELLDRLQGRVLVAHNARFDYSFLKNEFARVGLHYSSKPLCSVRLSRRLFSLFKRHSLDHLIQRFSIPMSDRHRGLDDALAIWHFFRHCTAIIEEDEIKSACHALLKTASLPSNLDRSEVDKLPGLPGVYRFYDDRGVLLYIGKSVNLKNRVMSHFSGDHSNVKDLKINKRLAHIDFDRCPSDFGAQILESQQIKSLAPVYNQRLRRVKQLYQCCLIENELGYLTVSIGAISLDSSSSNFSGIGLYRSRAQAKRQLEKLADNFFLCHQLLGLESASVSGCFRLQLKKCRGACCGRESAGEYNIRVQSALADSIVARWPWQGSILIKEQCKTDPEFQQCHLVDNWVYSGSIDSDQALSEVAYGDIYNQSEHSVTSVVREDANVADNQGSLIASSRFDLDVYLILRRFLLKPKILKRNNIQIVDLSKPR